MHRVLVRGYQGVCYYERGEGVSRLSEQDEKSLRNICKCNAGSHVVVYQPCYDSTYSTTIVRIFRMKYYYVP